MYLNGNTTTTDFRRVMEEASGMDLKDFFDQWLYKPGTLKYDGYWHYDINKKEIQISLNQIQTAGALFKMPVQIAVYDKAGKVVMQTLPVHEKKNEFRIPSDTEPANVVVDPNQWVLMEIKWVKK
jgi:aminopeptidase N